MPDLMHDVLEGALEHELKLMLKAMVSVDCYITIAEFNMRLVSMELGYMEASDRPSEIQMTNTPRSGTSISLKQQGAQQQSTCSPNKFVLTFTFLLWYMWFSSNHGLLRLGQN